MTKTSNAGDRNAELNLYERRKPGMLNAEMPNQRDVRVCLCEGYGLMWKLTKEAFQSCSHSCQLLMVGQVYWSILHHDVKFHRNWSNRC